MGSARAVVADRGTRVGSVSSVGAELARSSVGREPTGRAEVASSAGGVDLGSDVASLARARAITRGVGVVGASVAGDSVDRESSSSALETVGGVGVESTRALRADDGSGQTRDGSRETGLADTIERELTRRTEDAEGASGVRLSSRRATVATARRSVADSSVGAEAARTSLD